MILLLTILIVFALCFLGGALLERRSLPLPLESVRLGRLHHLILGLPIGYYLGQNGDLLPGFDAHRLGLIGIGVLWFGFRAGLQFDLRQLYRQSVPHTLFEILQTASTFALVFLWTLLSSPLLNRHMGSEAHPASLGLLLGVFAVTYRVPEPVLYWREKPASGPQAPAPPLPFNNVLGLALLGILFPIVCGAPGEHLSVFSSAGYAGMLALLVGMGLLLGVALDFLFRVHRNSQQCAYLSLGMQAATGAACLHLQIPGIFVGFLGGAWLINSSVRRREVLEESERAGDLIEPVFFLLLGSLLAAEVVARAAYPVYVLFGLALFLIRGLTRMIGVASTSRLLRQKQTAQDAVRISWRPLGGLAAAVIAQGLFLPLAPVSHVFVLGALTAVFLSQIWPLSSAQTPISAPPAGLRRIPQHG